MSEYKNVVNEAVKSAIKQFGLTLDEETNTVVELEEKNEQHTTVNESYVATPKPYKQVTEFISQKTKDTHVELYNGYIETVNKVSGLIDSANLDDADSKHSDIRSLKLDESYNLNAVWLHELFFANCFDPNSEVYMDSMAFMRLQRDFGTFDAWQKDFIACAKSCGEGWAVCGYNMFLKRFVNTVVSHHSGDVQLGLYPVIVLDVWSHAYFRDYLADKSSYVTAMLRELNWVTIEERFNKVCSIEDILKK